MVVGSFAQIGDGFALRRALDFNLAGQRRAFELIGGNLAHHELTGAPEGQIRAHGAGDGGFEFHTGQR